MLCLVHYLFVISTSVIDCLGKFVPEMTYYVLSGTLNLTKLKLSYNQETNCFTAAIMHALIMCFYLQTVL